MTARAAWKLPPQEIEERSFAIIDSEAGPHEWEPDAWTVVRRLVHTSADFDYVKDTVISPGAVAAGVAAVRGGPLILTDTKMALSGISRAYLEPFEAEVLCLVDDPRTLEAAKASSSTRSQAAVDVALAGPAAAPRPVVWAIGNAPTALYRLMERLAGDPSLPAPALVIGLPVGFVNAYESKRDLAASAVPHFITNLSRKGGSNVAAAAVNALAKLAAKA